MSPGKQMNQMEQKRFQNQIDLPFIGEKGQDSIKNAKIIVIGAGGKGLAAMQQLAAAGVGTIGICDNTLVDEPGLSRQNMFGLSDLGKQKAIVAKQYLEKLNSQTLFNIHNLILTEQNGKAIAGQYDIIVDATNKLESQQNICKLAIELQKPMVTGSINKHIGEVTVCYNVAAYEIDKHIEKKKVQKQQAANGMFGIPVIVHTITGAVMANEVLKILLNIQRGSKGKEIHINTDNYQINILDIG